MIKATFYIQNDEFKGFALRGHANTADYGKDILCAAVSSLTNMTISTAITVFEVPCDYIALETEACVNFKITTDDHKNLYAVRGLIEGMYLTLKEYEAQYPKNINVSKKKLKEKQK
jgi:uncharacterized protein YsxB (DUF464 family)